MRIAEDFLQEKYLLHQGPRWQGAAQKKQSDSMQRTLLHKVQRASMQRYGIQRYVQRAPVCNAWHTYVVIRTREDLGVIVTFQVTITEVLLPGRNIFLRQYATL
jgi:hypothetical protein